MTVVVEAGGRRRVVEVRRTDGRWLVTVDGRAAQVDAHAIAGRWSVLLGSASHDAAIDDRGKGELVVHVDGTPVPVAVARSRVAGRRGRDAGAAAGPSMVVAPMPGRIVKVLVQPGDAVALRQGLIVVEAMKMENELRSPKGGTVREVRVAEGALVEARTVLVVIE